MIMKNVFAPVLALSMAAAPLLAQQETPMQMAQRVDACNGREVVSARMSGPDTLAVTCGGGAGMGGGGLAAPAIGLGVLAVAAAALSGGSSSSDTQ